MLRSRMAPDLGSRPLCFRPTGPDTFVSSCSLMFGVILCCNSGERYKRVPGTNNFLHEEETYYSDTKQERVQGPAGAFGADLIARFHSKYIMFEKNGMEWMCCNGLTCNVPCSIPEAISKDSRAGIPWNQYAGVNPRIMALSFLASCARQQASWAQD